MQGGGGRRRREAEGGPRHKGKEGCGHHPGYPLAPKDAGQQRTRHPKCWRRSGRKAQAADSAAAAATVAAALRIWRSPGALPAARRMIARALSRWSMRPNFWKMRLAIAATCSPEAKAIDLASLLRTWWARGPQEPPTASTIMGMKIIPSLSQCRLVSRWRT